MFGKFKDQQGGYCGWGRVSEGVNGRRKFQRANWELYHLEVLGPFKGLRFALCQMKNLCKILKNTKLRKLGF